MSGLAIPGQMPGIQASITSTEATVFYGARESQVFDRMPQIASAAVDSGNSPTTMLRPGLVMARITSSGKWAEFDPTKTNGQEVALGVLCEGVSMLGQSGSVAEKFGGSYTIITGGYLKAASLKTYVADWLNLARVQLSRRFVFDDEYTARAWGGLLPRIQDKAANYTVVAADNFTLFTASEAAAFTLPAIARGYCFEFLNMADANMSVVSAEGDNIVWDNDASADSLAFSTSSHKIGGRLQFQSSHDGTKWLVRNLGPATCTVTAAT